MESWEHNDKTSHETITSTEFHWDFVPPLVFQLYSFAPGGPKPCSVAYAGIIISISRTFCMDEFQELYYLKFVYS
jgi:hypothetical protein